MPMSAGDLWFLGGVALSSITLLTLAADIRFAPLIGILAGYGLGRGSLPDKGSDHA